MIGDIYEAAVDAELWPTILERIADSIGGTATVFTLHDPPKQWGAVVSGVRADPWWEKRYNEYYCQINPQGPLTARLDVGALAIGQMAISDEALIRSEYYHDFLKPQDLFHLTGSVIAREGSLSYLFSSFRSRRRGQFEPDDLAPLETILPHLARAARISNELVRSGQVLQSFEALGFGVVLLDSRGRVVVANSRANAILQQEDGLALSKNGELVTTSGGSESGMLAGATTGAIHTALGKGLSAGGDVLLLRPSGKRPYRISVAPLRLSHFAGQFKRAAAVVFITDPEDELVVGAELLRKNYGVTKREAEVARLLLQGKDVGEICAILGVQESTVRTQVKALMQKFGVKRQVDLVLALTRLAGGVGVSVGT